MSDSTPYAGLVAEIKGRIQLAQTRAVLAVNGELIRLYWQIGQLLDERQATEGWGAGVIPGLARDTRNELPEQKGFSERNLKRMLAFYRAYRDVPLGGPGFVPQAVAQIDDALLAAVPRGHHVLAGAAAPEREMPAE